MLAVWSGLAVCHGWFWRTDQRLPPLVPPRRWPSVAVVVPARDEAEVLPTTLPTLLAQRYPGQARVILVDDNSGDGTGDLARGLAASAGLPLTVSTPGEPPAGWTGKLWAVAHGVAEAGAVDYLLFTDADIAHGPGTLEDLVMAAEGGRDLVSQMALLRAETAWERLIVPAFVYFFAMLYPFRRVNSPRARTAAAAGGCVLVRRTVLEEAGGIAAIRGAVIDDVALARLVKSAGGRIWLGLAETVHSVRPYPRLADLWHMVARSAYTQLRHSPLLLAGTVLGMAVVFLAPPALAAFSWPAALAWLLMAATFVPMARYYRRPRASGLLLPLTAFLYTAMTVDSARRHWLGRGARWKGRHYE
ncbi:glycosyltransferase [Amycolatopsis sp. K13G38]|uniref:Glycosyltransferase n=2 Tax=Amycolatopsis acididurans TaxID=2724524 RepID=A0ABX1J090_9PSEU|nr:glycosyltransferase [Amycolatopsis acididurans]